jgi:hypothetical protein
MKNALSEACVASALSNARRVTSTGETSRRAIKPRNCTAVIASKAADMECLASRDIDAQS